MIYIYCNLLEPRYFLLKFFNLFHITIETSSLFILISRLDRNQRQRNGKLISFLEVTVSLLQKADIRSLGSLLWTPGLTLSHLSSSPIFYALELRLRVHLTFLGHYEAQTWFPTEFSS